MESGFNDIAKVQKKFCRYKRIVVTIGANVINKHGEQ